jgi:hypothetical protein
VQEFSAIRACLMPFILKSFCDASEVSDLYSMMTLNIYEDINYCYFMYHGQLGGKSCVWLRVAESGPK